MSVLSRPATDAISAAAATAETMLHERCDVCGHRAFAVTRAVTGSKLSWCGHDFASREVALVASGAVVVHDSREQMSVVAAGNDDSR